MCMRNLNATILTCVEAKKSLKNSNVLTYNDVFEVIVPEEKEGKLYIPNFDIVINLVAMFDGKTEEYTFEQNRTYNCMLAVTFDGNNFRALGQFNFKAEAEQSLSCGRRSFYNNTFLMDNLKIEIPENITFCDFALLIKHPPETNDGKWVVQTLKRLHINKVESPLTNV